MALPMTLTPETALHRLRKLYRDAHHCEPPTDGHVLEWTKPVVLEVWATHQIRYHGWSFMATEATVKEARRLANRCAAEIQP